MQSQSKWMKPQAWYDARLKRPKHRDIAEGFGWSFGQAITVKRKLVFAAMEIKGFVEKYADPSDVSGAICYQKIYETVPEMSEAHDRAPEAWFERMARLMLERGLRKANRKNGKSMQRLFIASGPTRTDYFSQSKSLRSTVRDASTQVEMAIDNNNARNIRKKIQIAILVNIEDHEGVEIICIGTILTIDQQQAPYNSLVRAVEQIFPGIDNTTLTTTWMGRTINIQNDSSLNMVIENLVEEGKKVLEVTVNTLADGTLMD